MNAFKRSLNRLLNVLTLVFRCLITFQQDQRVFPAPGSYIESANCKIQYKLMRHLERGYMSPKKPTGWLFVNLVGLLPTWSAN